MPIPLIPGAAVGPGTPGPRAGSTARDWRASSASAGRERPWPEYTIAWRFGRTRYEITVTNPEHRCRGVAEAELDGAPVESAAIPLVDDGATHVVRIVLGAGARRTPPLGRATATA
jgi:hypothetical protein